MQNDFTNYETKVMRLIRHYKIIMGNLDQRIKELENNLEISKGQTDINNIYQDADTIDSMHGQSYALLNYSTELRKETNDLMYKHCKHKWVIDRTNCDPHQTHRICEYCDLSR
jgi:hypothetical protein